jgi:hypothetical protein|eukprot:COSAG01_NODE_9506_length_2428_cov_30.579648_2_plen_83_part_00
MSSDSRALLLLVIRPGHCCTNPPLTFDHRRQARRNGLTRRNVEADEHVVRAIREVNVDGSRAPPLSWVEVAHHACKPRNGAA